MKFLASARSCAVSLTLVAAWPALAHAEPPTAPTAPAAAEPLSPARVLFKEGRELVAQGDFKGACPKFEQSLALESGLGTQFNLADCWEHIGRTASAQALFIGAAASAKAAGQAEREQVLRERAAALEPRIPHLVIEVNDTDPKLVVKRGELPLDAEAYGKAKAVDPGSYEIMAKAPGKKPWTKHVEVAAGGGIVTVEVPKLDPALDAEAPPAPQKVSKKPLVPVVPTTPASKDAERHGPSLAAIGLGVVGVGGLAFGAIMAKKYSSANSDAKAICPTSRGCTSQQITDHDLKVEDARSNRNWAYAGFGVGVVGVGAAAALLFLPQSKSESAWLAAPAVAADGSLGATLSGKF